MALKRPLRGMVDYVPYEIKLPETAKNIWHPKGSNGGTPRGCLFGLRHLTMVWRLT